MATEYAVQRRFQRYPCDTGVLVQVDGGSGGYWGTLSDICVGGCYIYSFSPLPLGQDIELTIKANGKEIHVKGKVVSSHPGVGMGAAFTAFANSEGEATLNAYIEHLASQPQKNQPTGVFH